MGIRRAAGWAIGLAAVLFMASAATAQDVRTITPGMTTVDVKAEFGEPKGVSARGPFTYYFYDNGCEYECGFPDLVIFESDQVVDAVLRAPWHEYAGESSSPKGTVARPTPGGMRLEVPTAVETVEVRPTPMPPPPPVAAADSAEVEIADEFAALVPVCIDAMVHNGLDEGDARTLCDCTAQESRSLGVEPSSLAVITESLRLDPSYQAEDAGFQQALSICFDRIDAGIADEFTAFVPVCVDAMVHNGLNEGDARTLCECTAQEARSLGVEASRIGVITESLRLDPTYQAEDAAFQQAISVCFDRMSG